MGYFIVPCQECIKIKRQVIYYSWKSSCIQIANNGVQAASQAQFNPKLGQFFCLAVCGFFSIILAKHPAMLTINYPDKSTEPNKRVILMSQSTSLGNVVVITLMRRIDDLCSFFQSPKTIFFLSIKINSMYLIYLKTFIEAILEFGCTLIYNKCIFFQYENLFFRLTVNKS